MNCKEIENRKKVSKEMEEKLLKTMKQKQWNKNNETKTPYKIICRAIYQWYAVNRKRESLFVRFNEKLWTVETNLCEKKF